MEVGVKGYYSLKTFLQLCSLFFKSLFTDLFFAVPPHSLWDLGSPNRD